MMIPYRKSIEPLAPYIPGKPIEDVKREYGLTNVVKLASNENPLGCSPVAKAAVIRAMDEANYYPDGNCVALREKLAGKLGISTDEIIFGCGADEVLAMCGKVFVNEGDEAITARFTFSQYAASVESMGGKMIYAPMKDHGFDLGAIASAVTPRTKVIFVANPNNPTGTIFGKDALYKFLSDIPPRIFVVIDSAYEEYVIDPCYPSYAYVKELMKKFNNIMLIKTFSKIYGLASLRVGYGVANKEIVTLFEKVRPPFNVTIQGQAAALASLDDPGFAEKTARINRESMDYYCGKIGEMGLEYIPSQANFVMTNVGRDSREVFVGLMKRGYIIRPGAPFGMDEWIRVTMGTMEQMEGFIKALGAVLFLRA
ncbi:MAG: histidinol-phosphate transaminase [Clostridiales bacterium]|nr:histidinol-phosphate transaminase [Clostridiales bacterium]